MDCKYSYRGEVDGLNRSMVYCNKTNQTCTSIRYCHTMSNYKMVDNYEDKCIAIRNVKRDEYMKKGMTNRVVFEKNGILTIEILDINQAREIKNPYDYVPEYVELVNIKGEYHIKGFEPK